MAKRKRRSFSAEFKAEAVRLCQVGDRSIARIAQDLDLTETALREWVKAAEVNVSEKPPEALTGAEREELQRLRREVKRLQMEREILKKAAAFFARESECVCCTAVPLPIPWGRPAPLLVSAPRWIEASQWRMQ